MKKYVGVWYDLEGEKLREIITASSEEDARCKLYEKHQNGLPASQLTIVEEDRT